MNALLTIIVIFLLIQNVLFRMKISRLTERRRETPVEAFLKQCYIVLHRDYTSKQNADRIRAFLAKVADDLGIIYPPHR